MKDFLCPKKSSLKDDSNGTKNETDKRILWFFMIGQSFVKSIGVFPGSRGTFSKTRPVVKGLTKMLLILLKSYFYSIFAGVSASLQCV